MILDVVVVAARDLLAAIALREPDHIVSVIPENEWCGLPKAYQHIPRTIVAVSGGGLAMPLDGVPASRLPSSSVDIAAVIELGKYFIDLSEQQNVLVIVHCKAGICRSPAVALILMAMRDGRGNEDKTIAGLLEMAPCALPNGLLVELGDSALGRGGTLIAAWAREFSEGSSVVTV